MAEDVKHGLARGLTNYGDLASSLYLRRSFAKSMGYSGEMLAGPVVGIADSRSCFNNCHRHFPELIDAVKRGVIVAGRLPIEFPTTSLGEMFLSPTSMMTDSKNYPHLAALRHTICPFSRAPALV
jgi:dihydroxy-acid dehydratase